MSGAAATRGTSADPLLDRLSDLVATRLGLDFPARRRETLVKALASLSRELGFDGANSCAAWLVGAEWDRGLVEKLADRLTVGETFFFRNGHDMELLTKTIIPGLVGARRRAGRMLRFWSAGCCTGEEPYTLAMLLDGLIPDMRDWRISILATDINPRFLRSASAGIYGNWSFRETPAAIREKYFEEIAPGRFRIVERIRRMVKFQPLNLAVDPFPSLVNGTTGMDVAFCRNVLMYFSPGTSERVLEGIGRSVVNGGWLLTSPSEASLVPVPPFRRLSLSGSICFRKDETADAAPVPVGPRARSAPDVAPRRDSRPETGGPEEAKRLFDRGLYTEAAGHLETVLGGEQTGGRPGAAEMELLARTYANLGDLDRALRWCERAIAEDRMEARYHQLCAEILQELDRVDDAVRCLKKVLYLDGGFELAHFTLGNLCRRTGKSEEARRHFKNTLAFLRRRSADDIVAGSDGVTAGRLMAIIEEEQL